MQSIKSKKINNIKRFFRNFSFFSIFLVSFCSLVVSCGSTKVEDIVQIDSVDAFTQKHLSNGIPVVFKQNRGSKIIVLRLVFEGGASAIDKSLGGIEDLTLDLALRGSEKYSYETIKQLEYEKSIFLYSSSGKEFSTVGFTCIQRDMSQALDLLSECVKNPKFSDEDFNQKMTELSASISQQKSDPSGALSLALSKAAFENHPYATTTSVTEESYSNITKTLVNGLHQSLLNALRIKIVVVGNFSSELIDDFTASLEEKFGDIPRKAYTAPKIPKITVNSGKVAVANEQAGNTGYVVGLFEYPSRDSKECVPLAISLMYLDDLLFSQVREKAGAVYSINTGVIGGRELLGAISVYKASKKENLKQLIFDAISSFDADTLEKKLNQYKNKYIATVFSSSQTAAGLASSVISSWEFLGSESAYLKRPEIIESVTKEEVVAAYEKYVVPIVKENAAQWIIVDGEENLEKYDF